ncbi:MAG: LysR substrate-binding domain-containing protein [Erysipelotrichaceae bacterium]
MLDPRYATFQMLCTTRSFTKAAQALHLSQPAVSQQMHALQKQLGVTLFQYENRNVEITQAGLELNDFLCQTQQQNRCFLQQLKHKSQQIHLRFGATRTIGEYLVPNLLTSLLQDKSYHVTFQLDNTKILLDALRTRALDFALVEGDFDRATFSSKAVYNDRFICVYHRPLEIQQLQDLFSYPLLVREQGSGTRAILEQYLLEQQTSVQRFPQLISLGSMQMIKHLALEGYGVSFLYESCVKDELASGQLYEIKIPNLEIKKSFHFVYLQSNWDDHVIDMWYQQCLTYFLSI